MAKKPVNHPSPKVVAAAMKRVMPLVKMFPKELQPKEAAVSAVALGGAEVVHRTKSTKESGGVIVFGGDVVVDGSFDIGCVCIVLGDLTVRDRSRLESLALRSINCVRCARLRASGMAKNKKVPASSQLTARKTEAPMLVTRPVEEPKAVEAAPIARDEIARLAFAKFVARGYTHGHAVNDWLSAEAELRAANN